MRLRDAFRELLGKCVASYQPLPNSKHTVPTEPSSSQRACLRWLSDKEWLLILNHREDQRKEKRREDITDAQFRWMEEHRVRQYGDEGFEHWRSSQGWLGGTDTEEEDGGAWTK